MPLTGNFRPLINGWNFSNWGEGVEFTWELFRETYLGINPTQDCSQAPLDCAYFEIFKGCAAGGNCGGMSLLALALFKFGSYMGFCSPAAFYTGGYGPDRADLHRAINILQARQFSVGGIENFIDVVDTGNLNNAVAAYNKVAECLGSNDFAVLSIANALLPDDAHTVIPYRCYTSGGTRYMDIWDPNFPADDNLGHYDPGNVNARMEINGPTSWQYYATASPSDPYPYLGSNLGWCFAVPMSRILTKKRHPMTLDMMFDALQTIFISGGPGASISQISDDDGHRLYSNESAAHLRYSEIETDPIRRLRGVVRYPWFGQDGQGHVGELYFVRGAAARKPLNISVCGTGYTLRHFKGRNLIEINGSTPKRQKDLIRIISPAIDLRQEIEVKPAGGLRSMQMRVIRTGEAGGAWKSITLKPATASSATLKIHLLGQLEDLHVESQEKQVEFDLEWQERKNNRVASRTLKKARIRPGNLLHVLPILRKAVEKK